MRQALCDGLHVVALWRADQLIGSLLMVLQIEELDQGVKATATAMVVNDGDKGLAKDEREGDPVEGVRHHALGVEDPLEPRLYGRQDARLQSSSTLRPVAPRSEELSRRMMRLSDLPCELLLVRCVR